MITDSEFYSYDIQAKRKYLLDIFVGIKDTYPIYETIYTYLLDTEFPIASILDELYNKIEYIGISIHETEVIDHYHSIVDAIEKIRASEKEDIEPNPDYLLNDI